MENMTFRGKFSSEVHFTARNETHRTKYFAVFNRKDMYEQKTKLSRSYETNNFPEHALWASGSCPTFPHNLATKFVFVFLLHRQEPTISTLLAHFPGKRVVRTGLSCIQHWL